MESWAGPGRVAPPAGEPGRETLVIGSLCGGACGATGCEHALATWLAPFGAAKAGLGEERMALMSSSFWATMCAGRLLWAVLSGVVRSAASTAPVRSVQNAARSIGRHFFHR